MKLNEWVTVVFDDKGLVRYNEFLEKIGSGEFVNDDKSQDMELGSLLIFIAYQKYPLPYYMFIEEIIIK